MWSKETPKACRNFVQLCIEGYYDGTIIHRIVKGFIAQGGDPKGDGTGGESIYGHPFKDEFHTRLRFVRRGLIAMANSGKDDNASQFFFTMGPAAELQNKNTIFGKVTGDTLYNMLKLEECLVDQDDRPIYPHKLISTEVLSNPFPDIVPRITKLIQEIVIEKPKEKVKKNFKLLSFGEEAEEDEAEAEAVNEAYKGQSKSSHDLTDDPKLSSVPAISLSQQDNAADPEVLESIRKKLKKSNNTAPSKEQSEKDGEASKMNEKRKEIQKQIRDLKRELRPKKVTAATNEENEAADKANVNKKTEKNDMLAAYHNELEFYKGSKCLPPKGSTEREAQTLKMLEKFKDSLMKAKGNPTELGEENSWLVHELRAEDEMVLAKDANLPAADRYDITDPRHPINERRRNEKKRRR